MSDPEDKTTQMIEIIRRLRLSGITDDRALANLAIAVFLTVNNAEIEGVNLDTETEE